LSNWLLEGTRVQSRSSDSAIYREHHREGGGFGQREGPRKLLALHPPGARRTTAGLQGRMWERDPGKKVAGNPGNAIRGTTSSVHRIRGQLEKDGKRRRCKRAKLPRAKVVKSEAPKERHGGHSTKEPKAHASRIPDVLCYGGTGPSVKRMKKKRRSWDHEVFNGGDFGNFWRYTAWGEGEP